MTDYAARCGDVDGHLSVTVDGLTFGGHHWAWADIDGVAVTERDITLVMGRGLQLAVATMTWERLGRWHDTCADELARTRTRARRAVLGHGSQEPIAHFVSRTEGDAERRVDVLASGLWIEPLDGNLGRFIPWGLVSDVSRDGYRLSLSTRVMAPLEIGGLGARTDEFVLAMEGARVDIAGVDGWGTEVPDALDLSTVRPLLDNADGARLVTWREGEEVRRMLLVARGGHVLAEPLELEDHATFVFAADGIDRVNAAFLLGGLKREILWREAAELGERLAPVRTQPEVRWLRDALTERIIHDERWQDNVSTYC